MQIAGFRIRLLSTIPLIVVAVFLWLFSLGRVATAFDFHAESAHGNPTYGVNRSGTECPKGTPCPQGDCTHCHDTFDSDVCGVNDFMLFNINYFCVSCHKHPDVSSQVEMPFQGCYTYKFGGDTTITCPSHITSAFLFVDQTGGTGQPVMNCESNKGSAHYLEDIKDFLQNRWGFSDTLEDINPCEACHNPHKAQQHDYPVGSNGTSPISLPSTHDSDWTVYGAEATERMDSYAGTQVYLAPYYYNKWGLGKYEPDGADQQYGTNMPDYVTLCTDCHNESNDIWCTRLGRYLHKFSWDTEKHGRAAASDDASYTDLWDPYYDEQSGSYVLSCTDCHEPHGAPNPFLIRPRVNDRTASIPGGRGEWTDLCENCHMHRGHDNPGGPHYKILQQGYCAVCHNMHDGIYEPCINCHYHGGSFTTPYDTYKTF